MEKSKISNGLYGALIGVIAGIGVTLGAQNITSPTDKARFIEKENTPRIMKVYNFATKNQILIENPENAGEYIPLSKYFKYKNKCEQSKIECLVSQEEEK